MTELRDELVAIEGVAQAHVEIVDDGPPSVRLQVEHGADQRRVGELVQQILARHGLKSRIAPPRTGVQPTTAPGPPGEVAPATSLDPTEPPTGERGTAAPSIRRLDSVSVREGRGSLEVVVGDGMGGSARASASTGAGALRDAVVAAVHDLVADGSARPTVIAIERGRQADRDLLTVVLDRGAGRLAVGAAFVSVGWEFAFGRAVWSALTD